MILSSIYKRWQFVRAFAANFNSEELAYYAGLWHDLGKFHPDFQSYLQRCEINTQKKERGPGHKGAGAIFALHARLNLLRLSVGLSLHFCRFT